MKKANRRRWLGRLLLLIGFLLLWYPDYCSWQQQRDGLRVQRMLQERQDAGEKTKTEKEVDIGEALSEPPLLSSIEIPKMDLVLPLLYGAEESNLARGAAIMQEYDLPGAGKGSNCVIAGHRGYRGAPYFREIEKLQPGDTVFINTESECLQYAVESIRIINPDEVEALEVQQDREMVTLLTCHPYRGHGKYRYLVYCVRVANAFSLAGNTKSTERIESTESTERIGSTGRIESSRLGEKRPIEEEADMIAYRSSESDISREKRLRTGAKLFCLLMLVQTFVFQKRK